MDFRRLFRGAHGPLLAVCGLIGVVWMGSYRSLLHVQLPVTAGSTRWDACFYRGVIAFSLVENFPRSDSGKLIIRSGDPFAALKWDQQYWSNDTLAGLSVEDSHIWLIDLAGQRVVRRWGAINLPLWLIFSLAVLAPAHGLYVTLRAYRRSTHGQCADCGYELGGGQICQACAARAALIGASSTWSRVHLVHPAA